MFRAVITADDPTNPPALEVSGEVTPYDLQVLREHLLQIGRRRGALQVALRAARDKHAGIQARLGDLDRRGIHLILEAE